MNASLQNLCKTSRDLKYLVIRLEIFKFCVAGLSSTGCLKANVHVRSSQSGSTSGESALRVEVSVTAVYPSWVKDL